MLEAEEAAEGGGVSWKGGFHLLLLLLLEDDLPRHDVDEEVAAVPDSGGDLERLEDDVHSIGEEDGDGEGHRRDGEGGLEHDVHDRPVVIAERSAEPPPDVVRLLRLL